MTEEKLKEAFPRAVETLPDRQLIIFAHKLGKVDFCIDNIDTIMGMLLYILRHGINVDDNDYLKDFQKLAQIYDWLVNGIEYK